MFLSLTGQARDVVREGVDVENITEKDGLKNVKDCLDRFYLKDTTCSAYEAYEEFEKFIKPSDMKINDYIIKFEQLYSKAKSHKMEILDSVLAYRLLNGAGLSESHKQLVHATVSEMKYDTMKTQYTVCDGRPTSQLIPYKLFRTLRSESERLVRLFKFFIRTKEMEPCVNKPRIRVICIGMSTRTTYKCT